jgi:hypothetical protein
MMTIGELKKHLSEYPEDTCCAYDLWLPEDVKQQAEQMGEELSDSEIDDVLALVEKHKDATIGITWDTLDFGISEIQSRRRAGQESTMP